MLFGGRCVCFPGDLAVFICKGRHTPHLIFCPWRVVQGLLTSHAPSQGRRPRLRVAGRRKQGHTLGPSARLAPSRLFPKCLLGEILTK